MTSDHPDIEAIQAQASILMKRGIQLMNEADPNAPEEALQCFDRALELRRKLPVDAFPALGYGLAACWLNRAEAMVKQRQAVPRADVIAAYDEAILLLRRLPLGEDPRYPRRLGIAYQNRGLALLIEGSSAAMKAAASLSDAIAVFQAEEAALIPDRQYLLAVAWMNLAKAHMTIGTSESQTISREASRRTLALVADIEASDAAAAEVGLKARHFLCQTTVQQLSETQAGGTIPPSVHEATDAVDEGLALARQWEPKGVTSFRDIACDLFRYGAAVYQKFQPHFYEEFLRENADMVRFLRGSDKSK